jgi:hypothetical protein
MRSEVTLALGEVIGPTVAALAAVTAAKERVVATRIDLIIPIPSLRFGRKFSAQCGTRGFAPEVRKANGSERASFRAQRSRVGTLSFV